MISLLKKTSRPGLRRGLAFLFSPLLSISLTAQNPNGALRGVVEDASGARIPEARIVVQRDETSARRETVCNARGEFRMDDLIAGTYRVTDRKSTRLNSSHLGISYAVFCLKK